MSLASQELPIATGNLLELQGVDGLVEACATLLYNPLLDLVVVRNMFETSDGIVPELCESTAGDSDYETALYEAAPELKVVDELVLDYWESDGYADFKSSCELTWALSTAPDDFKGVHTDRSADTDKVLTGPLTISVCTQGEGIFFAEKPMKSLRDAASGAFNRERWQRDRFLPEDELRTRAPHKAGDALVFMNHPMPTFHAVLPTDYAIPTRRTATLFDYTVSHIV